MAGKSRKLRDEFGRQIGKKANENNDLSAGGGGGIRTHGTREGTTVFECGGGRVGTYRFVCNCLM